tara:strand:- start:894 stop:1202 length:309 start_codon:yes stop_codon:yes gene_type:complete
VLGVEQRSSGWRALKPSPRPVGTSLFFIAPLHHTTRLNITLLYINLIDIMSEHEDYINDEEYIEGAVVVRFALFGSPGFFSFSLSFAPMCLYYARDFIGIRR